ncbi:hypothetical protein [Actinomyces respiraculi]|uniref:hypothetical protein n=1 Tax=Actinomyces respiraculi TaxID=2744574 RepID=UPI001F31A43F|nr:hypothetical protein [Actinomyces respiraculi]
MVARRGRRVPGQGACYLSYGPRFADALTVGLLDMQNGRHSIDIDALHERYRRIVRVVPRRTRWLALVLAPAETSAVVLVAGLLGIAGSLLITVGLYRVATDGAGGTAALRLLVTGFLAEGIAGVVKERHETLLVAMVRQLTYRRFRDIFRSGASSPRARENVLTYPAQISQFAYVVDSAVSLVQMVAFAFVALRLYGAGGAAATVIIAGMVAVSVRLIHLVGALWEQYIGLEGDRRRWIQRVADALPRASHIPSWNRALKAIVGVRREEECLLRARVRLQTLNGFLERGALTTTLALLVVVGARLWPGTAFGVGTILAARYLYSAAQNNTVNYRVIRLAVPMLRRLDELETQTQPVRADDGAAWPTGSIEVLPADSQRARALRDGATAPGSAYVPYNPQLPQAVLSAWLASATPQRLERFTEIAGALGLGAEVVERLWRDAETLSAGERHRAAVSLVLADEPTWIILDDTFSALDPLTREVAANVVVSRVPTCTLLAGSQEYVPSAFTKGEETAAGPSATDSGRAESETAGGAADEAAAALPAGSEQRGLPDPQPERATWRRTVDLLFGPYIVLIAVGAVLLSGADVAFALTLAEAETLSGRIAWVSAACAGAALIGSLGFYSVLYRAPIRRLGELHDRLAYKLDRFAGPATSGGVVARLGEDFSDLQMSVPGAIGSVLLITTQSVMLVGGAVAGAPTFIIVVLVAVPLAVLVMRRGSVWILPASTAAANLRAAFVGAVGVQAGLHAAPVGPGLQEAGDLAYSSAEGAYVSGEVRLANAYALRSGLIQALVLALNLSATVMVAVLGGATSLVTAAGVIYFAVTLSSGIQSTIETLQTTGVVSLTAERVRLLDEYVEQPDDPPVRSADMDRLEAALAPAGSVVALIGATGAGKSVMLDALYQRQSPGTVALVPDTDPFADADVDVDSARDGEGRSGLTLARAALADERVRLILLDETLKTLSPLQERAEILALARALEATGRRAVVVLHSRANMDCFTGVVDLDG